MFAEEELLVLESCPDEVSLQVYIPGEILCFCQDEFVMDECI